MEKEIITKDNDEIKQAIKEIKKSVDSIDRVLTYILFIILIPVIFGFLYIFGLCGRR